MWYQSSIARKSRKSYTVFDRCEEGFFAWCHGLSKTGQIIVTVIVIVVVLVPIFG